MRECEQTIEQMLLHAGYGYRCYTNTGNTGRHEIYVLETGESVARFDAHNAATFAKAALAARRPSQPAIIFKNQHYTACILRDGALVVTHNRKRGGKHLVGAHAATWIDAIVTALDKSEANDLCRTLLN